jgi:hypothetical protein
MPSGEASMVSSPLPAEPAGTSTPGRPFASTQVKSAPGQNFGANAATYFATRSTLVNGNRAAPRIPPPSEVLTTSAANRSSRAVTFPA